MSGGRFAVKGGTGAATVTEFMHPIADRFTVLVPGTEQGNFQITRQIAAKNVNQWEIFNTIYHAGPNADTLTLGAMTTAPDGTNTAQKLVEATTNSMHYMTAVWDVGVYPNPHYDVRLAVFAKAAERTRVELCIGDVGFGNNQFDCNGIRTVFDLASGTVAIPAVVTNGRWTSLGDSIIPYADGWCLCMIDVRINITFLNINNNILAFCKLDAGTGAGAENITYVGDASKGLYVWKTSMLPVAVWGMTGKTEFFDDFDTLDTIDLTDSRAPGYNWYTHGGFPTFPGVAASPATDFSISSPSILRIVVTPATQPNLNLQTGAWLGSWDPVPAPNGTFSPTNLNESVGYFHNGPPLLIENRSRWTMTDAVWSSAVAFWTVSREGLFRQYPSNSFPNPGTPSGQYSPRATLGMYYEIDWQELPPGPGQQVYPLLSNIFIDGSFNNPGVGKYSVVAGVQTWISTRTYTGVGELAIFGGVMYVSIAVSTGSQPDISPGQWTAINPSVTFPGQPATANTNAIDLAEFHTYSVLWVPYSKQDNGRSGMMLTFFDDIPCQQSVGGKGTVRYNPLTTDSGIGESIQHVNDNQTWPIFLACANNSEIFFDWVRLTR